MKFVSTIQKKAESIRFWLQMRCRMSEFYKIPRLITVQSICTSFHHRYDENFYFGGEAHNFWELVFISEGSANVAKNDTIYNLTAGNIVFHPPMEFHRLWSVGKPFRVLVISFVEEGNALQPIGNDVFALNLAQQNMLSELQLKIDSAFTKEDGYSTLSNGESPMALQSVANHLELFLLDVLQLKVTERKIDTSRTALEFRHIIEVMNEYINQDLSVPEMAKLCGLSISNLKRICQQYVATGPAKHFMHLKIIRAMQLLKAGHSVSEISDSLNFSSTNYFSYVFRRETGYTPTAFKNDAMQHISNSGKSI